MLNILNQEIEVGTVVVRGGTQGSSSIHRIGRVTKVDAPKQRASVVWQFRLSEYPSFLGDNSRSSVSVHELTAVPPESLDRIVKVWEANNHFTKHTDRPQRESTVGVKYFSPEWKRIDDEYNDAMKQWESARKDYINNVLIRLGYAPMP